MNHFPYKKMVQLHLLYTSPTLSPTYMVPIFNFFFPLKNFENTLGNEHYIRLGVREVCECNRIILRYLSISFDIKFKRCVILTSHYHTSILYLDTLSV